MLRADGSGNLAAALAKCTEGEQLLQTGDFDAAAVMLEDAKLLPGVPKLLLQRICVSLDAARNNGFHIAHDALELVEALGHWERIELRPDQKAIDLDCVLVLRKGVHLRGCADAEVVVQVANQRRRGRTVIIVEEADREVTVERINFQGRISSHKSKIVARSCTFAGGVLALDCTKLDMQDCLITGADADAHSFGVRLNNSATASVSQPLQYVAFAGLTHPVDSTNRAMLSVL